MKITRIPTLRTPEQLREYIATLGIDLQLEDHVATGPDSPLARPLSWHGRTIGNSWTIHPMEGWDATPTGGITEPLRRRWERFGESGAKLIFGGEAMAVQPEGRANPNQLIINEANKTDLATLLDTIKVAHKKDFGKTDDLVIGFQLTHSGRFCRPHGPKEPRVAYRHPILDKKFDVVSDSQILTDDEMKRLIDAYVRAAKIPQDVVADFVDIKHCHGYLLHEFLSAHTRPGEFGGSFENRTRPLREIAAAIRAAAPGLALAVRLSAFDAVPYRRGPDGAGVPEDFSHCLPYRYGFGVNQNNPTEYHLSETFQFLELCRQLDIRMVNLSAGSPYYNPHIGRPAGYPPSDGYQLLEDPLVGVARQVNVVKTLKARFPDLLLIGTGYSYLQEYLPHVAQHYLRHGHVDSVGIGRAVLSYPRMLADAVEGKKMDPRLVCRTFSDCTTAPRNGLPSGCYPLDHFYKCMPEAVKLKEIKKG